MITEWSDKKGQIITNVVIVCIPAQSCHPFR